MDNKPTYYTDLISRYLSGEISGEELRLLSDWISADDAHKISFREYLNTWQLLAKSGIESTINLDDEWDAIQSRIKQDSPRIEREQSAVTLIESEKHRLPGFRNLWKIAAAIVVLLASTFLLYFLLFSTTAY